MTLTHADRLLWLLRALLSVCQCCFIQSVVIMWRPCILGHGRWAEDVRNFCRGYQTSKDNRLERVSVVICMITMCTLYTTTVDLHFGGLHLVNASYTGFAHYHSVDCLGHRSIIVQMS